MMNLSTALIFIVVQMVSHFGIESRFDAVFHHQEFVLDEVFWGGYFCPGR